jgi:hypothetical protein
MRRAASCWANREAPPNFPVIFAVPISRSHPGFVNVLHVGHYDAAGFFFYIMALGDAAPTMRLKQGLGEWSSCLKLPECTPAARHRAFGLRHARS